MNTHAIIEADSEALFHQTARKLFDAIERIPDEHVVLGLCGGRSIVGLLEAMAKQAEHLSFSDWRRLQFFMVDERLVPLEHEDSNYRGVHQLFLGKAVDQGLLAQTQLHPFSFTLGEEEAAVQAYQAELGSYGGRFHVAFLGAGEDAHVAGLFPEGPWVEPSEADFLLFDNAPKPPPKRMSATPALLRRSELLVGMFIGEGKRHALERFRSSEESLAACPVQILNEVKEAWVVTDLT